MDGADMRRLTQSAARIAVIAATLAGGRAMAQQCKPGLPANPPAIRRSIVGIVLDSANRPIENANVGIRIPRREARSGTNGQFTLQDLEPGSYEVAVRRLGYETTVARYVVADSGGVARFCLVSEARSLAPMISSVSRSGLSGIVGDSTYKAITGAEVRAVGENRMTQTDSTGSFYLPLKPGTYAIWVIKKGFDRQTLSVTIPPDSGRQVAVWLGPPRPDKNRFASNLEDMRGRLLRANPMYASLVSSETIARFSTDLAGVAQAQSKGGQVTDDCEAVIDGGPMTLPLYMIDKGDVAMMEVYLPRMARRAPSSIMAGGTRAPTSVGARSGGRCTAQVYVWMKP
jgi:hypothetical protein